MSFFSDFNKSKKPQDLLELNTLNKNDGEVNIHRMTSLAQGRIYNFERVYQYMSDELLQSKKSKDLDQIPTLVAEAKNDLDSLKETITALQSMQLIKKTEHQLRNQKIQRLSQVFNEMKEKLQKITEQFQQKQRKTIETAQSIQSHSLEDNQLQLLQDDNNQYDEQFIEKRQKQITQISKLMTSINHMMVEAAVQIDKQGEGILEIGQNIKSAKVNVNDASKQIAQASTVQKSGNNRSLMLCIIMTFIVIVVVLLFKASSRA